MFSKINGWKFIGVVLRFEYVIGREKDQSQVIGDAVFCLS